MVSAKDVTKAKREAREQHINDDGTTNADHIFEHVPEILGVNGWHRHPEGEKVYDKEHLWRRDDKKGLVYMERTRMGWLVETTGDILSYSEEFGFSQRKHAEAKMVSCMKQSNV
jgi:hypothetical protein